MTAAAASRDRLGSVGVADEAAAPRGPYSLVDTRATPIPFKLTWAREALHPGAIRLRKQVTLLNLVKCTAKVDVTLPDLDLVWGFSCKDTLFDGRFSANIPDRFIEYRKKFSLPNGNALSITAGAQHIGERWDVPLREQVRPILSAQLHFGDMGSGTGNIVFTGDGFSLKPHVPIPRRWIGLKWPRFELEAYANLKVPQLTAHYGVQRDRSLRRRGGDRGSTADSRDEDALHVHVAAANIIVRL